MPHKTITTDLSADELRYAVDDHLTWWLDHLEKEGGPIVHENDADRDLGLLLVGQLRLLTLGMRRIELALDTMTDAIRNIRCVK